MDLVEGQVQWPLFPDLLYWKLEPRMGDLRARWKSDVRPSVKCAQDLPFSEHGPGWGSPSPNPGVDLVCLIECVSVATVQEPADVVLRVALIGGSVHPGSGVREGLRYSAPARLSFVKSPRCPMQRNPEHSRDRPGLDWSRRRHRLGRR